MARSPAIPSELTIAPFTLDDARRVGISPRQLQGASWTRLGRGLYVWSRLAANVGLRLSAIQSQLPPTAAFSGITAARLHGLDLGPAGAPIEVTLPRGSGISPRVGVLIRRSVLREADLVVRQGLRTTSLLRTLAELGRRLPLVEAVVAVDMAFQQRLIEPADLSAWVSAWKGWKGVVRFRRVARLAEPAAESPMETRLRLRLVLAGLPRPEAQVELCDESGRFVGRVDLFYRSSRLAIEYDGATHRESLIDDNRRQNLLLNAGYRLLRFTAPDVMTTPDSVVAQVRAILQAPREQRGA